MIPFRVILRPGTAVAEQLVYAAKKAIVAGQLRPGDPFPSVRALSRELKINPNTAHKVITILIADGLLQPKPGVGTVVAPLPETTRSEKTRLLGAELETLVVESKRLGVSLEEVLNSVTSHWKRLSVPGQDNKK